MSVWWKNEPWYILAIKEWGMVWYGMAWHGGVE